MRKRKGLTAMMVYTSNSHPHMYVHTATSELILNFCHDSVSNAQGCCYVNFQRIKILHINYKDKVILIRCKHIFVSSFIRILKTDHPLYTMVNAYQRHQCH